MQVNFPWALESICKGKVYSLLYMQVHKTTAVSHVKLKKKKKKVGPLQISVLLKQIFYKSSKRLLLNIKLKFLRLTNG